MMLTEYNEEETRKSFFEEGRAEGEARGEARARAAYVARE